VPADTAFVCDVQDLRFPEDWKYERDGFDAVFTNAALHWYGQAQARRKTLMEGDAQV
jgi:hypothetical protein